MGDEAHDEVRKFLDEHYDCYVLVTCGKPSSAGKMNVEMDYSGDPVLASYLLQGAQEYLDEQEEPLGLAEDLV